MLITSDMPEFEFRPFTPQHSILFEAWCKRTNAYYYARPAESFNKFEAVLLAERAKADILLLENLS